MNDDFNCHVCGLELDGPPWGENGQEPNFNICPCCGVEFGYEDSSVDSTRKYREEWIAEGAKWFNKKAMPSTWNLDTQLKNIPLKYR